MPPPLCVLKWYSLVGEFYNVMAAFGQFCHCIVGVAVPGVALKVNHIILVIGLQHLAGFIGAIGNGVILNGHFHFFTGCRLSEAQGTAGSAINVIILNRNISVHFSDLDGIIANVGKSAAGDAHSVVLSNIDSGHSLVRCVLKGAVLNGQIRCIGTVAGTLHQAACKRAILNRDIVVHAIDDQTHSRKINIPECPATGLQSLPNHRPMDAPSAPTRVMFLTPEFLKAWIISMVP